MSALDDDGDLKRLLAVRRDIDQALLDKHSIEMAVLFTDIVGSTQYFESKGDIEGLARVHQHNDLLFPVVSEHGGRIVKTIGDAIMAVFPEPALGVDAAAAMQRRLRDAQTHDDDPIRVRIGVHAGRVMVDGDDVFGDTVNTAARVASAADGDEVLLSRSLYDALPAASGHHARPRGELSFKGKAEPFPVVVLRWGGAGTARGDASTDELFVLELGVTDEGLRVAAVDGAREKQTVKAYGVQPLTRAQLDDAARHIATLAHGGGERGYMEQVERAGKELFATTLSERARTRLRETELSFLRLHLDDNLVQVPWELLHDGETFLGLRFAVGRVVAARADAAPPSRPRHDGPGLAGHCVVVSNPTGDLPAASTEGTAVRRLLADAGLTDVRHLDGAHTRADVLEAVRGARLVHFAGHTGVSDEGAPGISLHDGVLPATELADGLSGGPPELFFLNGCRASTSAGWSEASGSGLAPALLMRGVEHYLAPAWEIPDDDALFFALRFYERCLFGAPYGEAAQQARRQLQEGGARPLSFAGYALFGEPRASFSAAASRPARAPLRSSSKEAFPALTAPAAKAPPQATIVPASDPSRHAKSAFALTFGAMGVGAVIALGIIIIALGMREDVLESKARERAVEPPAAAVVDEKPAPAGVVPNAQPGEGASAAPSATRHEGAVRVSVLPFKNISGDEDLDYLKDGLAEVVVTDFGSVAGVQLIERGQIDVDIGELEFSQSKYVDPATRAALGKIAGAEVAVLGAFQRGAGRLRATARFVDVETGEVLVAVKVDRPENDVFELQDELAKQVKEGVRTVKERMRP